MALFQFVLPTRLRRIKRQESNEPLRLRGDVSRYFSVRNPESRQSSFPAKHYGLGCSLRRGRVLAPAHVEIDLTSLLGLFCESEGEVLRIAKVVSMYVNNH